MKILFICRQYFPHIGGVETHVQEISSSLRKRKHKIVILTEKFDRTLRDREIIDEIRIIRFAYPKVKFLGLVWIWLWFLRNLSIVAKSDLVHIHDVFIWYLPLRFLLPQKPVFVTFHGWEGKYPVPLKFKMIRKIAEKLTRGNICIGDFIRKWYETKTGYVTYGGVNKIKNEKLKIKQSLALRTKNDKLKVKILFIGRLDKDTGLLAYLNVLKVFKEDFKITFLGDGPLRDEAGKYGRVVGFVENIAPYIASARFVFTSGYLSIFESLAAKKLVFAVYDNPIKQDYLKMTPFAKWIVIEQSPRKLVKKIEYFLKHSEEEERRIGGAFEWVSQQTWNKVVDLYLKLWEI